MSNRSRHTHLLFILLCFSLLLTGCWDSKEIEQLAIITSLGIDRLNNGEWQVSARLLNPQSKSAAQGGQPTNERFLLKGTGQSMGDAINDFGKRIPRIIFWGDLENVIIGEKAAKEDIKAIVEVHLRHREGRPRTNLMITQGEAYDVLQTAPEISTNLSKEIKELNTLTLHLFGKSCRSNYAEFTQHLLSPDRDPIATGIKTFEPGETKSPDVSGPIKSVFLSGLAVFSGQQLAGWLDEENTLGYILATRNLDKAEINVPMKTNGGNDYSYMMGQTRYKIIPHVEGDQISYTLEVKIKGIIVDSDGLPLNLETIYDVEKQISDNLLKTILRTIEKSKEYNSDFMGFSEALHRRKPEAWKKIKSHWRDSYKEASIEVVVEAKVTQTGRHGEQFKIQKEQ